MCYHHILSGTVDQWKANISNNVLDKTHKYMLDKEQSRVIQPTSALKYKYGVFIVG